MSRACTGHTRITCSIVVYGNFAKKQSNHCHYTLVLAAAWGMAGNQLGFSNNQLTTANKLSKLKM